VRPPQAAAVLGPEVARLFRELPRAGRPADLQDGNAGWRTGRAGSRGAGTEAVFYVCTGPDGEVVTDARFQAYGCPHTLATAAWIAARLPGRPLRDLAPGTVRDWAAALGVPVERLGRLLVLEDALKAVGHARADAACGT
jgi:NifU-like protein involved in Fe-S cluster formation